MAERRGVQPTCRKQDAQAAQFPNYLSVAVRLQPGQQPRAVLLLHHLLRPRASCLVLRASALKPNPSQSAGRIEDVTCVTPTHLVDCPRREPSNTRCRTASAKFGAAPCQSTHDQRSDVACRSMWLSHTTGNCAACASCFRHVGCTPCLSATSCVPADV